MAGEFELRGLKEALRKIRTVKFEITRKAVRSSAGKAMRIVRDAAKAGAARLDDPTSASNIAKAIGTSTRYNKQKGEVIAKVGVRGGARPRPGREDTGHWRHIEIGTSKMRAQPFMLPALMTNVDKVTNAFVSDLSQAIDRTVARAK